MDILLKPDELCLSDSMNHFVISTRNEITFVLGDAGTGTAIVRHTYTPNKSNRIEVDLENIVSPLLSFELKDTSDAYRQSSVVRRFKVDIAEVGASGTFSWTFSVLRAGVDHFADSAVNFLKANFLTWQPTVKPVTYYTPEFLTYYAVVDSVVRCKAYVDANGKYDETTLTMANLSNGSVWTVPVQYAIIAGKLGKLPSYYDVWVEDASGTRLTYIQRYYASDIRSEEEQWVLFENSLGGIDTFRAYGDSENTAKHTHSVVEIENESEEYRVDTEREFKKNTGFLSRDERKWLLDFFPSLGKYLYVDAFIRKIVVTDSDVTWRAKELPSSYTFTYKYADARPYLNLSRTDMPAEVLDIKIPDVASFTVAPRLVELDRLQLSGGALFPVQNPYSDKWNVTTAAAILEYLAREITAAYKGDGAFGHTHDNMSVLAALDRFGQYLTLDSKKVSAGYADEANDISAGSKLWDKLLRKDIPDTTRFLLTLLDGIAFKDKYGISGIGEAVLKSLKLDNASIDEDGRAKLFSLIISQVLQSADFDIVSESGFGFTRRKDGKYQLSVTDLIVWGKAIFHELEIRRLSYVGGNMVFSSCGSKVTRVEMVDAAGHVTTDAGRCVAYRCHFYQDDGTTATTNLWKANDQARCQTFNIREGKYAGVSNRSYWRRVTAVGDDYIDLSKEDCEQGSDIPAAEDSLVQMGNRTDTDRMALIYVIVNGDDAPAIVWYDKVNSYTLTGRRTAIISPRQVVFSTQLFKVMSLSGVAVPLVADRGIWLAGEKYAYYDRVSHGGSLWLCVAPPGTVVTSEPAVGNPQWQKQVDKGDKGDPGKDGKGVTRFELLLADGDRLYRDGQRHVATLEVSYIKDGEDVSDKIDASRLVWSRESEAPQSDDEAWGQRHANAGTSVSLDYTDMAGKTDIICALLDENDRVAVQGRFSF